MPQKIISIVFLLLVPFCMGVGYTNVGKKDNIVNICKSYNRGFLLFLFPALILSKWGSAMEWEFTKCLMMTYCCWLGLGAFSLYLWICKIKRNKCKIFPDKEQFHDKFIVGMGILLLLLILQFWISIHGTSHQGQDNTVEILNTILSTDFFNKVNPDTGMAYQWKETAEMYSPVLGFYAMLSKTFAMHPAVFVYRIIPLWMLILFSSVCGEIGETFWPGNEDKKVLFAIVIQILNLFGTPGKWLVSYYLLYEPWVADSILCIYFLPLIFVQIEELTSTKIKGRTCGFLAVSLLLMAWISDLGKVFMYISIGILIASILGRRIRGYDRIHKLRT